MARILGDPSPYRRRVQVTGGNAAQVKALKEVLGRPPEDLFLETKAWLSHQGSALDPDEILWRLGTFGRGKGPLASLFPQFPKRYQALIDLLMAGGVETDAAAEHYATAAGKEQARGEMEAARGLLESLELGNFARGQGVDLDSETEVAAGSEWTGFKERLGAFIGQIGSSLDGDSRLDLRTLWAVLGQDSVHFEALLRTTLAHAQRESDPVVQQADVNFQEWVQLLPEVRSDYLAFHLSPWCRGPYGVVERHEALIRVIAEEEQDDGLRASALRVIAARPRETDVLLLQEILTYGATSQAQSSADEEGKWAARALAQLCAQRIREHGRLGAQLRDIGMQLETARNQTSAHCRVLSAWLTSPRELLDLAALRFPPAVGIVGPERYRQHTAGLRGSLIAELADSGSATGRDRASYLEEHPMPIVAGDGLTPHFNGAAITLQTGYVFEALEQLTYAQQFLETQRPDGVRALAPPECTSREDFVRNCARMKAEAECAPVRYHVERGLIDQPLPFPHLESIRQAWLRGGEAAARAQVETEVLAGSAEVGGESYRSGYEAWWSQWEAVQAVTKRLEAATA